MTEKEKTELEELEYQLQLEEDQANDQYYHVKFNFESVPPAHRQRILDMLKWDFDLK